MAPLCSLVEKKLCKKLLLGHFFFFSFPKHENFARRDRGKSSYKKARNDSVWLVRQACPCACMHTLDNDESFHRKKV